MAPESDPPAPPPAPPAHLPLTSRQARPTARHAPARRAGESRGRGGAAHPNAVEAARRCVHVPGRGGRAWRARCCGVVRVCAGGWRVSAAGTSGAGAPPDGAAARREHLWDEVLCLASACAGGTEAPSCAAPCNPAGQTAPRQQQASDLGLILEDSGLRHPHRATFDKSCPLVCKRFTHIELNQMRMCKGLDCG